MWDYPRPPRIEASSRHIEVGFNEIKIADSKRTRRVLETAGAPVFYFPPDDVKMEYFTVTPRSTFCEWKGSASYYTIAVGERAAHNAAWTYL